MQQKIYKRKLHDIKLNYVILKLKHVKKIKRNALHTLPL